MFFIVIHIIDQILIFVKRSTKIFSIKIQTNVLILLDKTFVLRVISPCIGQDTRKVPVPVKETSGQVPFPLLYEACDSSADMALTGLPSRRRIGREGGILHNKKRYPSKLCPHGHCISIHLQRWRTCAAEACHDGLQRMAVCLRCDLTL